MKKMTVRKRIFRSNAGMILWSLFAIFLVNVGILKIFWESVERKWQNSLTAMADTAGVEHMIAEWTIHQREFYILLILDAVICVALLVFIGWIFTKKLAKTVMEPVEALEDGVFRVRQNNLSEDIFYEGDVEFESICDAFNEMQKHLAEETQKNQHYEAARTEMIAGISHDLRTPLTAVQGTIKAVLDGVVPDDKQQKKFLETAYRRTHDMNELLQQLFLTSQIDGDKFNAKSEDVDLVSFLSDYVEKRKLDYEKEGIVWKWMPQETVADVSCNPDLISRIFDNLLENSIKYGEVQPLVITLCLTKEENRFHICFSDNGNGVPENVLERIFDEFYRADESRNKKAGNGLGLYLVKRMVETMQGTVWAENKNGLAIHLEFPERS